MVLEERLKKALRKIGQNIENHGLMSPQDFTHEDISLLYSLGVNLYEQDDYIQSKNIFERLVLAKPHEKKFWMALGACLQMQRLYEDALTAWIMAMLIEDEDPIPHFHAAECLIALERLDEAHQALEDAKRRTSEGEHEHLMQNIEALETTTALQG